MVHCRCGLAAAERSGSIGRVPLGREGDAAAAAVPGGSDGECGKHLHACGWTRTMEPAPAQTSNWAAACELAPVWLSSTQLMTTTESVHCCLHCERHKNIHMAERTTVGSECRPTRPSSVGTAQSARSTFTFLPFLMQRMPSMGRAQQSSLAGSADCAHRRRRCRCNMFVGVGRRLFILYLCTCHTTTNAINDKHTTTKLLIRSIVGCNESDHVRRLTGALSRLIGQIKWQRRS